MKLGTLALLVGFVAFLAPRSAQAQRDRTIDVPLASSRVIHLGSPVSQINVSEGKFADVKVVGRGLVITGRKVGQTEISFVDGTGSLVRWAVNVIAPIDGLAARLNRLLPGESIKVEGMGGTVVLTGSVSDALVAERAKKLAEAHLQLQAGGGGKAQEGKEGGGGVISLLKVGRNQQVQLRVKIAEVSRSVLRQMGINAWYRSRGGDVSGGILAPGTNLNTNTAPNLGDPGNRLQPAANSVTDQTQPWNAPLPLLATPFADSAFGLLFATNGTASFPLSIAVNLLADKGLAKVLSEPTLVAYTGQEAKFLAGGEFPVPIPQGLGQTSIEYKKFGVQLTFTPLVLSGDNIHLKLAVAVSEKDQSGAVVLQNVSVPALITRSSETTVRLKNGQSFAVAGLIQDRMESASSKVPLLGDLPIVGMLFRRSSVRRQESELVVLVTANLVQPLSPGEVPPLPGEDEVSYPSDLAFYLLGVTDVQQKRRLSSPAGPVGFSE